LKRDAARAILSLIPPKICERVLGVEGGEREMWVGEVEGGLGVWEEGWVNRHVLWRVVEVVVVRVVPELELGKGG